MWRTGNSGGSPSPLLVWLPFDLLVLSELYRVRPQEFEYACFHHALLGIFTFHGFSDYASIRHGWLSFLVLVVHYWTQLLVILFLLVFSVRELV